MVKEDVRKANQDARPAWSAFETGVRI